MAIETGSLPPEVEALVRDLSRENRRVIARLLTIVENGPPEHVRRIRALLHARAGRARITGVTGSPGVGKSTLVGAVVGEIRQRGRSVAILAVDPSSPFSGGAVLGDRVRMERHHADDGVYIRSMSSRGHLGGLSFAVPTAVLALDAAGFEDILIETVGVGQSEVDVAASADTSIVVLAPGMGDSIQAAKAGILEVADVLVINKADHPGAGQLHGQLLGMLELASLVAPDPPRDPAWQPPIIRTVAMDSSGIADIADAIEKHAEFLDVSGERSRRLRERTRYAIRDLLMEDVRGRLTRFERARPGDMEEFIDGVIERRLDPGSAAERILKMLD